MKNFQVKVAKSSSRNEERLYSKESYFDQLVSLRKNASIYLKEMESKGLDDKYREVYAISEKLQKYPKDKATWLKEKQRIEAAKLAEKKRIETKKLERLAKIKEYDEKKDKYYREIAQKIDSWEHKDGIKIGMNFTEFQNNNKDWLKATYKTIDGFAKKYQKKRPPNSLEEIGIIDNKIAFYEFEINSVTDIANSIKNTFDNLKTSFGDNLVFDRYVTLSKYGSGVIDLNYFVIKSPYSKNKVIVNLETYTINMVKMIGDFEPQKYETTINKYNKYSELAFDPAFLDRYVGVYYNNDSFLNIKRDLNFPFIVISNSKANYYYARKEDKKNEFSRIYYMEKNEKGEEVGTKKTDNSASLVFNIEEGTVIQTYDGKENLYTIRY